MNPTDQRIDQLLHALGSTTAPAGIEQRVNARLAQREVVAEHRASLSIRPIGFSLNSRLPRLTLGSGAILAIALAGIGVGFTIHWRYTQTQSIATTTQSASSVPAIGLHHKPVTPPSETAAGKHRASNVPSQTPSPSNDAADAIDALALAETLAPSHPAPALALTDQETLLIHSTRPGQPLEIATLDLLRESALSAVAEARERASIREYVHGLLGPLATAQVLTPASPPSEEILPATDIEPPSSH
jgi:hypothetical protein